LSHATALAQFQMIADDGGPLHLTAFNPRHPRGVPARLVVHRTLLLLHAVWRNGLPVVRPAFSLVAAGSSLDEDAATAALIRGCRSGWIREVELTAAMTRGRGVRGLTQLLNENS